MNSDFHPHSPLAGKAIFISASCPDIPATEHYSSPDPFEVDGAISAITAAILRAGGTIVFGGHPTIAPLIQANSERFFPVSSEADDASPEESARDMRRALIENGTHPVIMYLSGAFTGHIEEVMKWMIDNYWVDVRWIDGVEGESPVFDEITGLDVTTVLGSLLKMRNEMLRNEQLVAGVFIGGKKGIRDEFDIFREGFPSRFTYAFASPEGVAKTLCGEAN